MPQAVKSSAGIDADCEQGQFILAVQQQLPLLTGLGAAEKQSKPNREVSLKDCKHRKGRDVKLACL